MSTRWLMWVVRRATCSSPKPPKLMLSWMEPSKCSVLIRKSGTISPGTPLRPTMWLPLTVRRATMGRSSAWTADFAFRGWPSFTANARRCSAERSANTVRQKSIQKFQEKNFKKFQKNFKKRRCLTFFLCDSQISSMELIFFWNFSLEHEHYQTCFAN